MGTMAHSIPLECRLCPKKPDFSDVSHLLTHVASKAHLSRYYQMKVKGSADDQVRQLVDEYDDWYEQYSIDDLMRDRLNSKDKRSGGRAATTAATRRVAGGQSTKRTKKSAATADTPAREATASSRSTPALVQPSARRAAPRSLRDSVLNPQLEPRVKIEPLSRSGTPLSSLSSVDPREFIGTRYAEPSWPNTPYAGSPMKQEAFSSSRSDDDDDSFAYAAELEARRAVTGRGRYNTSTGGTESVLFEDEYQDTIGETTSDVAKLKGLVWPGMAMFDSATPDMRRKRNQKKDYSVIEQLQATSEFVEPNEMVFDVFGTLRRERVITGNPEDEDDELLSGEIEPEPEMPKKRPTRKPRMALADKHTNTGRVTRRRAGGSHHPGGHGKPRTTPYFGTAIGDDDDLTFGGVRPKKRSGLSIHRDNSGPDITFDQPAPMNYITSGFRNPIQTNRSNGNPLFTQSMFAQGSGNHGHQRLPSFTSSYNGGSFGSSFRPSTAGSMSMNNLGSFGGLNAHTLFQQNPYQTQNNITAMPTFQQQFGHALHQSVSAPQQSFNNTMFQPHHTHGHAHTYNTELNDFDIISRNFGLPTGDDFQHPGTELNPLFFSSNHPTPRQEDDEATVSPPISDRER